MKDTLGLTPFSDPFKNFEQWFNEARRSGEPLPEAMTLATASREGYPGARVVLLKSFSPRGFVFYTNYGSRKAHEIRQNSKVTLLFHWAALARQVRIEGRIAKTSRRESIAYFKTRPRDSQLGAWASPQSSAIGSRAVLDQRMEELAEKFAGKNVPCPSQWGGYRVSAERVEFWQGRSGRLHDRLVYLRSPKGWKTAVLAP